jgi:hypothetical protein
MILLGHRPLKSMAAFCSVGGRPETIHKGLKSMDFELIPSGNMPTPFEKDDTGFLVHSQMLNRIQ